MNESRWCMTAHLGSKIHQSKFHIMQVELTTKEVSVLTELCQMEIGSLRSRIMDDKRFGTLDDIPKAEVEINRLNRIIEKLS